MPGAPASTQTRTASTTLGPGPAGISQRRDFIDINRQLTIVSITHMRWMRATISAAIFSISALSFTSSMTRTNVGPRIAHQ